jgi:uncharacterized protein with von Willebrand factor type A (vWA) domain
MTETPRTDQRAFKAAFLPPEAIVTADFARELERELAAAKAEVAKANAERDEARRMYCEARYREERADLRSTPTSPHVIADERGWDCFEKEANQ